MTRSRVYVARDDKVTVVSRGRVRLARCRPVRRGWRALVETTAPALEPRPRRSVAGAALVILPPVLAGLLTAAFATVDVAFGAAGAVFFGMAYLVPALRGRRALKGPRVGTAEVHLLSAPPERAAFAQAIEVADGISRTWPALGSLIDAADAEVMLAEALWEIAGVLALRQQLGSVLAELSRPDFAALAPGDDTARELHAQLRATKEALSRLEIDLARRVASLRHAEEAGRNFIREQEMRRAIRAAEETLRTVRQPEFAATTTSLDAGAELAQQTESVLVAYRELTAVLLSEPPRAA